MYFQPPVLLKQGKINILARNYDISEPVALIHKSYFGTVLNSFFISMVTINIVIT